jgi:hypothetical protein
MAQMDVPYNFLKNNTLLFLHVNEINGLKKLLNNFCAWLVDVVCAVPYLAYGNGKALRSLFFLPSFPNRNPENAVL